MNTLNAVLTSQLAAHIDSHQTAGHAWPCNSSHAIVYKYSTWPCGWEKETTISFFTSEKGVEEWVHHQTEWARCEDNYVAFQVYFWDLGPSKCDGVTYSRNVEQLDAVAARVYNDQ